MAGRAHRARGFAGYTSSLFTTVGRLLFAAGERCAGRGAKTSRVLDRVEMGQRGEVNAEICDRKRNSRSRQYVRAGLAIRIAKVLLRTTESRPADSVAAKLRYQRQNRLHLHRAERTAYQGTRSARRVPRESDFGNQDDN